MRQNHGKKQTYFSDIVTLPTRALDSPQQYVTWVTIVGAVNY